MGLALMILTPAPAQICPPARQWRDCDAEELRGAESEFRDHLAVSVRHVRLAGQHQPAGELPHHAELRHQRRLPQPDPEFRHSRRAQRNQQAVGNALTNFFNTNGSIPLLYRALSAAGLTQASGESATGSQQATFDAMSQFMGLLTDPFMGRGNGFGGGGTSPTG
jgi:hypothetical protein